LALNNFKKDAEILGKYLFQKKNCTVKKRILKNICKIWHLPKGNLPKIIIIWHKVPNMTASYGSSKVLWHAFIQFLTL
jgi:hypothetical protein